MLDFARPVVHRTGPGKRVEAALEVCIAVWNQVVREQCGESTAGLDELVRAVSRQLVESGLDRAAVVKLADRKRTSFADDRRQLKLMHVTGSGVAAAAMVSTELEAQLRRAGIGR